MGASVPFRFASCIQIAQFLFARFQGAVDVWINQSRDITVVTFAIILDAPDVVLRASLVFKRTGRPGAEESLAPIIQVKEKVRTFLVARLGQLGHGELAIGAAGMAADEGQLAVLGTVRIPFQEMFHLGRLSVFVSAEDANIEIEAWILKVVRVAAIKRDLLFRREDQTDVGVTLETIR